MSSSSFSCFPSDPNTPKPARFAAVAIAFGVLVIFVFLFTTLQVDYSQFKTNNWPGIGSTVNVAMDKQNFRLRLDYTNQHNQKVTKFFEGNSIYTVIGNTCHSMSLPAFFHWDNMLGFRTHKYMGKKILSSGVKCKNYSLKSRSGVSICLKRYWFYHEVHEICDEIDEHSLQCVEFFDQKYLNEETDLFLVPNHCPK
ncbi:hypothetical protein RCL1_008443 [Eukaryota sp. TZLM3-RCL]